MWLIKQARKGMLNLIEPENLYRLQRDPFWGTSPRGKNPSYERIDGFPHVSPLQSTSTLDMHENFFGHEPALTTISSSWTRQKENCSYAHELIKS